MLGSEAWPTAAAGRIIAAEPAPGSQQRKNSGHFYMGRMHLPAERGAQNSQAASAEQ